MFAAMNTAKEGQLGVYCRDGHRAVAGKAQADGFGVSAEAVVRLVEQQVEAAHSKKRQGQLDTRVGLGAAGANCLLERRCGDGPETEFLATIDFVADVGCEMERITRVSLTSFPIVVARLMVVFGDLRTRPGAVGQHSRPQITLR